MKERTPKLVRTYYGWIFGAYTLVVGALFLWKVLSLYISGTAPDYAGSSPFTRERVTEALSQISLAFWLWIAAIIAGFVLWEVFPVKEKPGKEGEGVMNSPAHNFVRRTIAFLIGYKRTTIIIAFAVLGLSIFGMTRVKNLFFSDFDYKQFVVECFFPSAADANAVRDNLLQMSKFLSQNPEIERVAASQGSAPAFYCLVRPMTSGGDCYGELMVDCKDYKTVVEQIPAVRTLLREQFPDAYIRIRKYNFSTSTSHTVEVEFSGPDPAVLRELSAQAEDCA